MSADTAETRNFASAARAIIRGAGAQLAGRERGPDHATDRDDRRIPRRHSYEENDQRAKPWRRIGDGSVREGIIHKEVLVDTADALRAQLHKKYPRAQIRERQHERAAMQAELDALQALSPAERPVGRPATLRTQIARHAAWLELAKKRLRRIDVDVLRGLLRFLTDFATGKLFPSYEAIAERAGVHVNSVAGALARLRAHGLLDWVRRTTRTGNVGEAGPQLEQTSNAYELAPRRLMASQTWSYYWTRLCAKLKRPRAAIAAEPPSAAPTPDRPPSPLLAAVASLGASVSSATT